uniref:E3 ubiquitin-protein ligase TRAIP-like n=1 Tax=Phallusia mammillata TaxID=59560 RepID=A0A6F9DW18_9ASCI|nr:E3 ubiquitin-protein ligase TRAIP-like [Phallusia mammillata]
MSLKGSCVICTDYFDKNKDISVTNCGHVFHAECLAEWIRHQKTCPQCRTRTTQKQIIEKIFLNVTEETEENLDPLAMRNQLNEAECDARKLRSENRKLHDSLKVMEDSKDNLTMSIKKLKKEVQKERNTLQLFKSDMEIMKNEVQDARLAKEKVKELRSRLKLLERVEIVLNGRKSDVDDMISQYTNNSGNSPELKQLALVCVSLKQEFETVKQAKNKASIDLAKLRKDVHRKEEMLLNKASIIEGLESTVNNLQKSEDSLTNENISLKRKLKALQNAIASPSDTKSSAVHRLIAESPAPEFLTPISDATSSHSLKRGAKLGEPILMKKPRLSSSFNEDVIDLDTTPSPTKTIPLCDQENILVVSDSPATNRIRKHCKEMGINFAASTSTLKTKPALTRVGNSNNNFTSLQRNKLIKNKAAASAGNSYDGLGGHKKMTLMHTAQARKQATTTSALKFSSVNSTNFKVPTTNFSKDKFNRLKRIGPK